MSYSASPSSFELLSPELARNALEAAPDAMIIIDGAGVVRFANRQVSALFGYSCDEIVGQAVELLIPERFRAKHLWHRQGYVENLRVRPMGVGLELFGRRRDGTEFPVEISLSPIGSDDLVLVAAAIRDVSERKRIEVELIEARHGADQARDVAERANRAKSRFLATASHDLRQPLQTLELLNGTLNRLVRDSAAVRALAQQAQAIDAMSRLLSALLDISKLESGTIKPDLTNFAVSALFAELRNDFANIANRKGLEFLTEECPDQVHSDRELVEQVLRNLLSNAIKYTRQGYVLLRCRHERAAEICIEVLDTGIGIPDDQIRYIYDEFYQVGVAANSTRTGYGLGLSIVQRIVKLLGLTLEVRSEVSSGSVFSLRLPGALGHTTPARLPPEMRPHLQESERMSQGHVLLLEDDPGVLDATQMLLKVEGYRVTAAASLAEALQLLKENEPPDLIVADYHLRDGETGIDAIGVLRRTLGKPTKAVLVTGDTSSAVRHLPPIPNLSIASKPIRAEELLILIQAPIDIGADT